MPASICDPARHQRPSRICQAQARSAVRQWYLANADSCWLASIALGEMAFGIARLDPGARRSGLEDQLTDWRIAFAARTHGFQASTALIYGKVLAKAQKVGRPMSVIDAQIAAIAIEHGFALATRNVSDFTTTELKLVNPWLDQPDVPRTA